MISIPFLLDSDNSNKFPVDETKTGEMPPDAASSGGWWSAWGVSKLTGAVQEKVSSAFNIYIVSYKKLLLHLCDIML